MSTFYFNSQKRKLKLQMNVIANMTHSNRETNLDRRQAAGRQSWRYRWEGSLGRSLWTAWWPAHSEIHCCGSVEESVPGGHLEPPGAEQRRQNTVSLQNLQHECIFRINIKLNSIASKTVAVTVLEGKCATQHKWIMKQTKLANNNKYCVANTKTAMCVQERKWVN